MPSADLEEIKRILVYQDATRGSAVALNRAVKLAKRNSATLKVIDVVSDVPRFFREVLPPSTTAVENFTDTREARLKGLTALVDDEDVEMETEILQGRPFLEIIREVVSGGYDILMKDAYAASSELFFGSLDQRLLRYCPQPVWLVKPHAPHKCERVVAAIDPEVDSVGQRLNETIIRLALAVCQRDEGELSVVSVWRAPWDALEAGEDYRAKYEHFKDDIETAARANVERALSANAAEVPTDRIEFVAGIANDCIVEFVDKVDADLLVMGTVARTGIAGLLIGNTAEKVLRRVRCSVLTVKPDGFVSPLQDEFEDNHFDARRL